MESYRQDCIYVARHQSASAEGEVATEIASVRMRPERPGQPLKQVNVTERFVYKNGQLIVYVYYDPSLGLTRDEREAMKGGLLS